MGVAGHPQRGMYVLVDEDVGGARGGELGSYRGVQTGAAAGAVGE